VDLLSGQWESQRRFSSDMVFVCSLALAFAVIRYLAGWGPAASW
jgi:hypothetical protein